MTARQITTGSRIVGAVRGGYRRLQQAVAAAWVTDVWRRISTRLATATAESWLARAWARLEVMVRASWIYRWLTAEPEPDVIVIDLRETWTVGPVIRLLDWMLAQVQPAVAQSAGVRMATGLVTRMQHAPLRMAGGAALGGGLLSILIAGLSIPGLVLIALGALGVRDDRSWETLAETRLAQWLVAAFEPPEPPERAESSRQALESEEDQS